MAFNDICPLEERCPACKSLTVSDCVVLCCVVFQELVGRHEREVQEHQAFIDACNTSTAWIRSARETLATSADTYGDRETVQAKQDKVKVSNHGNRPNRTRSRSVTMVKGQTGQGQGQ